MINQQLLSPRSIVVVGGSDDTSKPGGAVLRNLIDGPFNGDLYVLNPKKKVVQGIPSFARPADLPEVDLAILAVAAKYCYKNVSDLAGQKNTRAFIVLSAGFGEESEEGKKLEQDLVELVSKYNAALIGPNCIGFMNHNVSAVFTTPLPSLSAEGVDFISGSGATAVFIMEAAIPNGLQFSSVFSVGNSAQTGVEDVLEYLDNSFDPATSSRIKLLYIESIEKPDKLLKHASSLVSKGCRIAAVKSGGSEAGSRAASSHTGAMASPDLAVDALFRKAGIVRVHSRTELATMALLFSFPELKGKNIAVISHAGGPAVMLTDALSNGGLDVPPIEGSAADQLLEKLFPGSSVSNPIDFLATGTAEQLGEIMQACEKDFDHIDAMVVIFGSPGLFPVHDVYRLLHEKMKTCKKPVYPVLPSVINAAAEIEEFHHLGRGSFPDEVMMANAMSKAFHTPSPMKAEQSSVADHQAIRRIVDEAGNGYLVPEKVQELLDAAGIHRAKEAVVDSPEEALEKSRDIGFPLVMKVVGPVHKSDVGGVVLNVDTEEKVAAEFDRMMQIKDTTGILMQPMLKGMEIFMGAKRDEVFGHILMLGLGGIFIEVLKDVQTALVPVPKEEVEYMIRHLRSYKMLQGVRGQEGVNTDQLAETAVRLSGLLEAAPEIFEMDLNPLLGNAREVIAVDARIRIEK